MFTSNQVKITACMCRKLFGTASSLTALFFGSYHCLSAQPKPMAPSKNQPAIGLNQPAELKLSADIIPSPTTVDKPIVLLLSITNLTAHDIKVPYRGMTTQEFKVGVRDKQRVIVPLTVWGKYVTTPLSDRVISMNTFDLLKPGQAKTYRVWLNRIYDMTMEGTYSITASRSVLIPGAKAPTLLKSNTATAVIYPTSDEDVIESQLGPTKPSVSRDHP